MKKRIFAIALALSMSLGTVPAYAQTTPPNYVPIEKHIDSLLMLHIESYIYALRKDTTDLMVLVNGATLLNNFTTKEDILEHITNVQAIISDLESIDNLITENHIEPLYYIQTDLKDFIASAKIYVNGCMNVYNNKNSYGYELAESSLLSIYRYHTSISTFCDYFNLAVLEYIGENKELVFGKQIK